MSILCYKLHIPRARVECFFIMVNSEPDDGRTCDSDPHFAEVALMERPDGKPE